MDKFFIKQMLTTYKDFPKKGIEFLDVFPLLEESYTVDKIAREIIRILDVKKVDKVVGIEARGFILAFKIASLLGVPFKPVRKKGKLPGNVISRKSKNEYAEEILEMQEGSIDKGDRVIIIDDILATGGTVNAAIEIVSEMGGIVKGVGFITRIENCKAVVQGMCPIAFAL